MQQLVSLVGDASLTNEIANILRGRIITGEYAIGERMVENQIARELKVSRTPVREALKQLVEEKLIEYVPNKGCFAKGFSKEDMMDIYAVRKAVEILAVEMIIAKATDAELAEVRCNLSIMKKYTECKSLDKLLKANEDYHNKIFELTKSRFIIRALKAYQDYIHVARKVTLSCQQNLEEIYWEHERIYHQIEARNVEGAKAEVIAHLERSVNRALRGWKGVK